MKKQNWIYSVLFLLFGFLLINVSCTKQGPPGPAGKDGEDGIDGKDGTAGCIVCHDNSETIENKSLQWEASVHATGGNFERNTTDCAPCHTSQGFRERVVTGDMTTAETIENPNPQNCYTCHKIHETYTADDWTLRVTATDDVTFWINGKTHGFGQGNICAECHQARIPDPLPRATATANDSVTITSPYWGLHHGPQSNMLAGTGAVELSGSVPYTNAAHTEAVSDACVTCHMATAYGTQAGGHTMNMTYMYHGSEKLNTAGCVSCHKDQGALSFLVEYSKKEVEDGLTALKAALVARGVFNAATGQPKAMKMKEIEAAAILNYLFVEEDRSEGVHNTDYAVALLTNSREALQDL